MSIVEFMDEKKSGRRPKGRPKRIQADDRHKPRKMTSIRHLFVDSVERVAERLGMDVTEWVNMAIREKLERDGLWPPAKSGEEE
jgi:hypothetical protein